MPSETDNVAVLADIATNHRIAKIQYHKPSQKAAPWRWIEPYKLVEGYDSLLIRCFQLRSDDPKAKGGWKCFRADRVGMIEDTGEPFKPRTKITLMTGEIEGENRYGQRVGQDPQARYLAHLQDAMMDGIITPEELATAQDLQGSLSPSRLRAVHGSVYAAVLQAALIDGEVTDAETDYLQKVKEFLDTLGWAP